MELYYSLRLTADVSVNKAVLVRHHDTSPLQPKSATHAIPVRWGKAQVVRLKFGMGPVMIGMKLPWMPDVSILWFIIMSKSHLHGQNLRDLHFETNPRGFCGYCWSLVFQESHLWRIMTLPLHIWWFIPPVSGKIGNGLLLLLTALDAFRFVFG